VVTSRSSAKRGHLSQVLERLPSDCTVQVFNEIDVEPDWETVQKAIGIMRQTQPDTVIALGGGSVLDAAKIMRLFYDYPNLSLQEVTVKFLDFRHRMVEFPQTVRTQLVAIPTTSGTGSEVTPFAVLKDNNSHRKYSLIDETLLPNIAIIDANLTKSLPKAITVDTAFDALTHALESLVSTYASDYTDGLALEAMRNIFEALPEALKNPNNIVWRHKLHNAACLAGMAIGNASVGVNHALAHSLGALFDIPHGKANSAFLLSTVAYNAGVPNKFTPSSTYPIWVADQKYVRAAKFLGLQPAYDKDRNGSPATTIETKSALIRALQQAIYDLAINAGQPLSISELGVPRQKFDEMLPLLVRTAAEDMSLRTNPSLPLINDITGLMIGSFAPRTRP
jgi:acetaldehyde dehydrogenase/alcohol dehydrogenase